MPITYPWICKSAYLDDIRNKPSLSQANVRLLCVHDQYFDHLTKVHDASHNLSFALSDCICIAGKTFVTLQQDLKTVNKGDIGHWLCVCLEKASLAGLIWLDLCLSERADDLANLVIINQEEHSWDFGELIQLACQSGPMTGSIWKLRNCRHVEDYVTGSLTVIV